MSWERFAIAVALVVAAVAFGVSVVCLYGLDPVTVTP